MASNKMKPYYVVFTGIAEHLGSFDKKSDAIAVANYLSARDDFCQFSVYRINSKTEVKIWSNK